MPEDTQSGGTRIQSITTLPSVISDPVKVVMRYARAVRRYIGGIIRDKDEADDVSQDLMTEILHQGFARKHPDRGRFRDYLKAAARNVALGRLRKRGRTAGADIDIAALPDDADPGCAAEDRNWVAHWQTCVLEMAWKGLEMHQFRTAGNRFHTALRLTVDFPQDDSEALAGRLSKIVGHPVRADAFRKVLSRARRKFAELLLDEVRRTLENPTPERLEDELIDIGLLDYVKDFLPPDWRTRGELTAEESA